MKNIIKLLFIAVVGIMFTSCNKDKDTYIVYPSQNNSNIQTKYVVVPNTSTWKKDSSTANYYWYYEINMSEINLQALNNGNIDLSYAPVTTNIDSTTEWYSLPWHETVFDSITLHLNYKVSLNKITLYWYSNYNSVTLQPYMMQTEGALKVDIITPQ